MMNVSSGMPALFVGHGSPMNAIEDNEFSLTWSRMGDSLPRPKSILCISAHWETTGTYVTAMEQPRTIHDFYGFPESLYAMRYPAPGSPSLARQICTLTAKTPVYLDEKWGLDHGTWSVLTRMFPKADIPVVQLSLDKTKSPMYHYGLAQELRSLRNEGVLIIGSGNIVHNLGMLEWNDTAHDWASLFDEQIRDFILAGNHDAIIHYERLGNAARLSIPTNEHFLPLLYILALQKESDTVTFFAEKTTLGAISMRSLSLG